MEQLVGSSAASSIDHDRLDQMTDSDKHPQPATAEADVAANEARRRFIEDLEQRGEVVPEGGKLPPGATHELSEDEEHRTTLRRRRFSAH